MPGTLHSNQTKEDGLHAAVAFHFANEADRLANANRVPSFDTKGDTLDLKAGELVQQLDTRDFFVVDDPAVPSYFAIAGDPIQRSVFFDELFGFDSARWDTPPVYVSPGGVQSPGGVARLTESVAAGLESLRSFPGIVDRALRPIFEARVRVGAPGTIADMIVLYGMLNASFADSSYFQYNTAGLGVSATNWLATTGSDATVEDTGIAVVIDTWYRLRIEELADRVKFSIALDPDGSAMPVLTNQITTNLPTVGVTDREVRITLVTLDDGVTKAADTDYIRMTQLRVA